MIYKKYLLSLVFLVLLFLLLIQAGALATPMPEEGDVVIYFFYGDGCPHCADEEPFLESLAKKYPQVNIKGYEVWYDPANLEYFKMVAQAVGFEPTGVPATIIGDQYWVGFREEFKTEIETAVKNCIENSCKAVFETDTVKLPTQPAGQADSNQLLPTPVVKASPTPEATEPRQNANQIITLPIIGEVDLGEQSLAVSTLIIGFVDGFNPCSVWVLSILLALTITSGSRAKTIVVGATFLLVTTFVYSLFILGVFTLFSYVGYLKWIQILVALLAIGFGLINIKDYLWYKEGISFTISDKHKSKLYKDMRSTVITPRSLFGLIGTTAALAVGVSLIEFSCTAGFPVIWSNIMIANNVSNLYFLLLLSLYMFVYLLVEIAVFAIVAVSMKAARIEEKHGRLLKLLSGVIMLALGIVMAINPAIMNRLSSSLIVFASALALTWLIFVIHQKVLPRLGIFIGSGLKKSKKRKHH